MAATATVAGCQESGEETPARTGSSTVTAVGSEERPTDTAVPEERAESDGNDETGENVAWRRSFDGAVTSLAAPGSGRMCVGTDAGTLASLSPTDGRTRWTTSFDAEVWDLLLTGTGTLLVKNTSRRNGWPSDSTVAVSSATGNRQWEPDLTPTGTFHTLVGTVDETAYIGTGSDDLQPDGGGLSAVSLADGAERWSVEVGDPLGGVVTENRVHVTHGYGVEVVGHDGEHRWQKEPVDAYFGGIAAFDDTVAVVSQSHGEAGVVVGYDPRDGTESWRFTDFDVAALGSIGDRLLVGGEALAALDPATGERQWRTDVTVRVDGEYSLFHDTIAGVQADGSVYILDDGVTAVGLADGTVEWRTALSATEATGVGLFDGQLLVRRSMDEGGFREDLVVLDASSGERRWTQATESEFRPVTVGESRAYAGEDDSLLAFGS